MININRIRNLGDLVKAYEEAFVVGGIIISRYVQIRDDVMREKGIKISKLRERLDEIMPEIIKRFINRYPLNGVEC